MCRVSWFWMSRFSWFMCNHEKHGYSMFAQSRSGSKLALLLTPRSWSLKSWGRPEKEMNCWLIQQVGIPQARWMVYFMENPSLKCMIWGTPILGNLHKPRKDSGWIIVIHSPENRKYMRLVMGMISMLLGDDGTMTQNPSLPWC